MSHKKIFTNEQTNQIIHLYSNNNSLAFIAKQFSASAITIGNLLKNNGTQIRSSRSVFLGGKSAAKKRARDKNKILYNQTFKNWRVKNAEHFNQWRKEHRIKNKERFIAAERKLYHKLSKDPIFRLHHNLRGNITNALKHQNSKKIARTFQILHFTSDQLHQHLESLFTDGMTWENYGRGGWHIDHKRPISSFNFTSETDPEFKKCWALSNLQPLWETTRVINGVEYIGNLNKHAKIIYESIEITS